MVEATKIIFRYRRIDQIEDITDLAEILFPGNRNQQYAAAHILLALKTADGLVCSFAELQRRFGISRRILERSRAKLARLGLIEHVTWMNTRHGGRQGWKLSGRMSTGLRQLADRIEQWRTDKRADRCEKDGMLVNLLQPVSTKRITRR